MSHLISVINPYTCKFKWGKNVCMCTTRTEVGESIFLCQIRCIQKKLHVERKRALMFSSECMKQAPIHMQTYTFDITLKN